MPDRIIDSITNKYYTFVEEIGRGSFGKCFLAVDKTNNYYACKTCIDTCFEDEIQLHSELEHENIVKFINGFNFNGINYLILELCDLGTVNTLLKCRKVLTDPEVKGITRQISDGLVYLHENLIIHRDLKLTNLLLSAELVVKISDFGLSTKLNTINEKRDTICGTTNFMAPEINNKKGYHFAVDIWSLGCIIFTLLDGKPPFPKKRINDKTHSVPKLPPASMTKIDKLAWKFLKTIFVSPLKRPSAKTVCLHPYFDTYPTSVKLELASFYQKPKIHPKFTHHVETSHNLKKRALQDCTNINYKSNPKIHYNTTKGKENNKKEGKIVIVKMQLRSRKRIIEVLPSLQEAVSSKGSTIAKNILDNMLLVLEIENEDWDLEIKNVDFACVIRWVAGLTSFGYHTSDGGLGVYFNRKVHIYRSSLGNELYIHEKESSSTEEILYGDALNYINGCLEMLATSGFTCPYKKTILVVAKKFFQVTKALPSSPTVAFLLSNGTCQVNFDSHEKLIVNCNEDIIVWWDLHEMRSCRFSDLLDNGVPSYLKEKIAFMGYFLAYVSKT